MIPSSVPTQRRMRDCTSFFKPSKTKITSQAEGDLQKAVDVNQWILLSLLGTPQTQVADGKQQHLAAHLISIKTRIRLLSQHIANHNREISSLAETTELKQKIFVK